MGKGAIIAVFVLMLARSGWADIIEWQDASGVRHFTNMRAEVPVDQRDSAQVVVDEQARRPEPAEDAAGGTPPTAIAAPAPAPGDAPAAQAQVIYDRSRWTEAYLQGVARGLQAAGADRAMAGGGGGGGVQINGPLAVASAPPAAYVSPWPYSYPFVTTSFDRGRSRHLTLRLLLQDQFAIDREGPYFFEERLAPPLGHVPLGVGLNPFLPRGLPHFFPREARVITR